MSGLSSIHVGIVKLIYFTIFVTCSTGVLIGLALRTGVPIYLPLPASFYAVLSNTSAADKIVANAGGDTRVEMASAAREMKASQLSEDATFALAMAVRTGIIATFPEVRNDLFLFASSFLFVAVAYTFVFLLRSYVLTKNYHFSQPALDLLSYNEVRGLLGGEAGYGPPSVLLLHRHATYETPLCAEDPHIMVSICKNCSFFNDTSLCLTKMFYFLLSISSFGRRCTSCLPRTRKPC